MDFFKVFLRKPNVSYLRRETCLMIEKKIQKPKLEKTVKDDISLDTEDIVQVVKEVEGEKKEKDDVTAPPLILDAIEESAIEKKIIAPVDSKVIASDKKPVVVKAVPIGEK